MPYTFLIIIIVLLLTIFIYNYFILFRIIKLILPNKKIKLLTFIFNVLAFVPLIFYPLSSWFIFLFYVLLIFVIVDIFLFMLTKVIKFRLPKKIYTTIILIPFLLSTIVTSYGYINAHTITKKEYNITSEKLTNDNYKIGLISDVHFGNTFLIEELDTYKKELNNENLDFLILAGDIVDELTKVEDYEKVFNTFGSINTKYGVYYIHGNHDESRYSNPSDNRTEILLNAIKNSNITFLNEESISITDDIIITGRIDYSYRNLGVRKNASDLIKDLDKNKYLIVADHQPAVYEENKNAGYDLQLSGHTHAGQIWPFGYITKAISFDYGHLKENNFDIIVSSGFGVWGYPIRTEEKSEYVIINLNKKQ